MQIYHVHTEYEDRWVLDPQRGHVKRREELITPSGTTTIVVPADQFDSTPDGDEFTADNSGTFSVPDDVAAYFLRQPGWNEGLSPFPPEDTPAKPTRSRKAAATESE
jgi:hypothetical protein